MKHTNFRPLLSLLLAGSLAPACVSDDDSGLHSPIEDPSFGDGGSMLPASRTAAERQGKADGFDPRDDYPEAYGFTAKPAGSVVLPGEFEPVSELILGWGSGAFQLEEFFVAIARAAASETRVTVYSPTDATRESVSSALSFGDVNMANVRLEVTGIDTIWMRDYGPMFVRNTQRESVVIDGRYYWGRWNDDFMPTALANSRGLALARPPIEIEGGNLLADGNGRCVTTERLVANNADLGYDAADVRGILRDYYGCQTTVIVPPIQGEGTGHVDMLVHLAGGNTALVGDYPPDEDPTNAARLDTAAARLSAAGFDVVRVPMPSNDGQQVFRTYTNALAVNGVVLLPVYDDDSRFESKAVALYQQAYPDRTIVPIDSDEVILWSGAVHCVTMTVSP